MRVQSVGHVVRRVRSLKKSVLWFCSAATTSPGTQWTEIC